MSVRNLNPYQHELVFKWKGEEVIVEFTNPNKPNLRGKMVEVNIWQDKFMIETDETDIWIHGGVRCVTKIKKDTSDIVPESMPINIRKEYPSRVAGESNI